MPSMPGFLLEHAGHVTVGTRADGFNTVPDHVGDFPRARRVALPHNEIANIIADARTTLFWNDHDGSRTLFKKLMLTDCYFALHLDRRCNAEISKIIFPPCLNFVFSEKCSVI